MYQLESHCLSLEADSLSSSIQIRAEYSYEFAGQRLLQTDWLYRFDQQGCMTIDVRTHVATALPLQQESVCAANYQKSQKM